MHGRSFPSVETNHDFRQLRLSPDHRTYSSAGDWHPSSSPLTLCANSQLLCPAPYLSCFHSLCSPHRSSWMSPPRLGDLISYFPGGGRGSFCSTSWAGWGAEQPLSLPSQALITPPEQPPCHLHKTKSTWKVHLLLL